MTGTGDEERDPRQELTAVVLKILGVAVAVGLVIGLGAWVLVKGLGLDSSDATTPGSALVDSPKPLPTTALPVPSASLPTDDNTGLVTRTGTPSGDLFLNASPVNVRPMERINLTGQWPGHDNEGLLVQRFEDGQWSDFGVQARVNVGTFETWVQTGRQGDQKFRVFDPETKTASNDVTVTIGG